MAIVCSVESAGSRVALTFDDGPVIPYTDQILDALAEQDALATFFVRGGALTLSTSEIVKQAHSAGHEIGNHTQNHCDLSHTAGERIEAEILETHERLSELLGDPPRVIRPPYGLGSDAVDTFASLLGYRATILWSITPRDWERPPADTIVARVLAGENPPHAEVARSGCDAPHSPLQGAIVLLHDGALEQGDSRSETVKAVREIVLGIRSRGLELVTVSELLAEEREPT
jgi:peptidoglycan-N-acetylglucosamine deacetylase